MKHNVRQGKGLLRGNRSKSKRSRDARAETSLLEKRGTLQHLGREEAEALQLAGNNLGNAK